MIFWIRQYAHYFRPRRVAMIFSKSLVRSIRFDYSCRYDLQEQPHANILIGLGYPKNNRAYFSWKWNFRKDAVEIYACTDIQGQRKQEYVADVRLGVFHKLTIRARPDGYKFMVEKPSGLYSSIWITAPKHFQHFGRLIGPTMEEAAPHRMKIEMN